MALALAVRPVITRSDVDAFLGMRPPRTISPRLGEYANRDVPALFVALGLVALAIGVALILVPATASPASSSNSWSTRLGQGLFMVALGGGTAFVTARTRARNVRLLRYGLLANAEVVRVSSRVEHVGNRNRLVLKIRLRYMASDAMREATMTLKGMAASPAQDLISARQSARILYLPDDYTHVLFIDGMVNSAVAGGS